MNAWRLQLAIDGGGWSWGFGFCCWIPVEGLLGGGVAARADGAAAGAVGFEAKVRVQVIDHCGGIVLAAMDLRQQQMRHCEIWIVKDGFARRFFGFGYALR